MIRAVTNVGDVIRSLNGKIESFFPGAVGYEALLRTVATTMIADIKTRIHENGIASDGSKIGSYSTKPMYVGKKSNVGKDFGRPIGKTGKSKFKGGKKKGEDHTSRYFEGGYNQYKSAIGRNTIGSVNLSLSGQLNNQLTIKPTENGYGIGWLGDTKKSGKKSLPMIDLAKALEKKYGKRIWGLTEEETTKTITTAKNYLTRALS